MKKLKLVLAVALIVITCSVLLIGCTPSKPNDYMTKWNESKNKSVTTIETMDKVVKEESEGVYKEVAGTTTIETTYISSGNILMTKRIEIINEKDKNGKDAKTDDIVPTAAMIYELTKDGSKYNIYSYNLVWEKESETSDKIVKKGKWLAKQDSKENVEANDNQYIFLKSMIDGITEKNTETAETFADKFTKGKGGVYTSNAKTENGYTETYKIKSGELLYEQINDDEEVVGALRYDLNDKATLSSGAKDALTKFLETKEGKISKIEEVKGSTVYTITIDGKDYKLNNKVTGYTLIEDAEVGDTVSVWLKKGFFGGYSIKEFLAFA